MKRLVTDSGCDMKRLFYIVFSVVLGTSTLCAQATDGVWLSSKQGIMSQHPSLSSGLPAATPAQMPALSEMSVSSGAFHSGSRYSSTVTQVGAVSVTDVAAAGQTMTKRRWPGNPGDPGTPLGEIPFVLMALLAAVYGARKHRGRTYKS